MIAVVRMPSDSQARTVSMVSVCEFPDENVVQTTPSAPSDSARRADSIAERCFSNAVSR